jgi:hypothetical protein
VRRRNGGLRCSVILLLPFAHGKTYEDKCHKRCEEQKGDDQFDQT